MTGAGSTAVTLQLIKNKIKNIRPLPIAVQKLYALVGDMNSRMQDVSQTIASDEMLSGKILQIANSAFYGLSSNIASIPQAVAVIGFQSIRSLALSISVAQLDTGSSGKQHRQVIWKESFMVASAARMIANHIRIKSPEDAFAAGIVHNIGQLVLLQSFPTQYGPLLTQIEQNPRALVELENRFFHMDHAQIGVLVCRHWKLPDPLVRAVSEHHKALNNDTFPCTEANSLNYILKRAVCLVQCMNMYTGLELEQRLDALASPWGNKTVLLDILDRLPAEMSNLEVFLGHA